MSRKKEIMRTLQKYSHFLIKAVCLDNHITDCLNAEIQLTKKQLNELDTECPAEELREASKEQLTSKIAALEEMQIANKKALAEIVEGALNNVYKKVTAK